MRANSRLNGSSPVHNRRTISRTQRLWLLWDSRSPPSHGRAIDFPRSTGAVRSAPRLFFRSGHPRARLVRGGQSSGLDRVRDAMPYAMGDGSKARI